MKIKRNDEWDYADALGHNALVRRIGHRLLGCDPPYVVGIGGSWGAGKTSFLRKLWVYLGGEIEWEDGKVRSIDKAGKRHDWFKEQPREYTDRRGGRNIEMVWFNPWQHQFESNPLIALLNEIRQHFSLKRKLFNQAGKLTGVAIHATLNSMTEIAKDLKLPLPSAKTVMERGREYEAEHFSTVLGSQRFRDFFESAIEIITGKNGLLVIFIDDLDRCEGEVSYRLLEALKLYLNAKNCVYVLGIDQQHLEISIARALSQEKETWPHRSLARDYLSKMFQTTFPLPVPRDPRAYLDELLNQQDYDFHRRLRKLFGLKITDFRTDDWRRLVQTLNRNLPHNPRKLKSFVASWKIYLDMLDAPADPADLLNWRLTLILQYLAQFEEPIYRRIEQFPNFYNQYLLPYCLSRKQEPHALFDRLELPDEESQAETGAYPLPPTPERSAASELPAAGGSIKPQPEPRFFWISRLINELATEHKMIKIEADEIRRHLPHAIIPD